MKKQIAITLIAVSISGCNLFDDDYDYNQPPKPLSSYIAKETYSNGYIKYVYYHSYSYNCIEGKLFETTNAGIYALQYNDLIYSSANIEGTQIECKRPHKDIEVIDFEASHEFGLTESEWINW